MSPGPVGRGLRWPRCTAVPLRPQGPGALVRLQKGVRRKQRLGELGGGQASSAVSSCRLRTHSQRSRGAQGWRASRQADRASPSPSAELPGRPPTSSLERGLCADTN